MSDLLILDSRRAAHAVLREASRRIREERRKSQQEQSFVRMFARKI
jgi:regulator of sirC expression with transglutaminase-like and TPR domain